MKNLIKKVKEKKPIVVNDTSKEAFLPILLTAVCLAITLILVIIDSFVKNLSGSMLAPIIAETIALFIPMYLCLLLISPGKSAPAQLQEIGMRRLHAEYIFFIIFSSLFLITTAYLLNVIFGGIYPASNGFTLLASFTAGVGEYSASYLYLVFVYALFPAIVEELLFRGLIYSLLEKIGQDVAIVLSTVVSSLFAFTLGGLPAALLCGFTYCFIRYTTKTLQSCMIVHFIFNLYALFLQPNLSKYFISSPNNLLLIIIVVIAWLIALSLFFAESARIYKSKQAAISEGKERSDLTALKPKPVAEKLKEIFAYKPTLIVGSVAVLLFISITAIGYFC